MTIKITIISHAVTLNPVVYNEMVMMRNLEIILTMILRRNDIKYSVNVGEN